MSERRVGVVVTGGTVRVIDANIPDNVEEPIEILADDKWDLQQGPHPEAYDVMFRRCSSYGPFCSSSQHVCKTVNKT